MGTIREARERLAELAPSLNPEMYGRLKAELDAAEQAARNHAEQFVNQQLERVDARRHELLVEVCSVRDSYSSLRDESALGRLSGDEYGSRLQDLDTRRDRAEARLADVEREVDRLGGIEDDPLGWADEQHRKYPTTAPTFSF